MNKDIERSSNDLPNALAEIDRLRVELEAWQMTNEYLPKENGRSKEAFEAQTTAHQQDIADLKRLKSRAEALERALKSEDVNAYNAKYCPACATCAHCGTHLDTVYCGGECGKERRNWRFCEARFK